MYIKARKISRTATFSQQIWETPAPAPLLDEGPHSTQTRTIGSTGITTPTRNT